MFKGVNIIEFSERFATDDACRKYLLEFKWENGYQCGKCGHTHFYEIKRVGSRNVLIANMQSLLQPGLYSIK